MIKIIPKNNIVAEIECNLKSLSKTDITKIKSCLIKYGLIYFRKQKLTSKEYLKFSKIFGKPAFYPRLRGLSKKYPQITVVQRKSTDKGPSFGEQFHTDSSYTKKPPKFTMLFSKIVPRKGLGNTDFSSQYLAYKHLPLKLKIRLFKHQTKKQFQYSLEWEKDQIAIWDNRSMLHQATAFNGNRKMYRITIQ